LLDRTQQAKWQDRLSAFLSPNTKIEFSQDDSLIAGTEIHFPHAVLRFNWRDTLGDLQKNLREHVDAD
jgi:F-type H+-transporting ATPase subunit b